MNLKTLLQIKQKIKNSRKKLKLYKNLVKKLSPKEKQIAIGVLLGDASLQTQDNGQTYRLKFEQSDKHKQYLFHLYKVFQIWVLSPPKLYSRINKNKVCVKSWRFQTISHNAFNFLADLFLSDIKKKHIKKSKLENLLTPLSVAYWYMDDGGKQDYSVFNRRAFEFHTHCFSELQVIQLSSILQEKFGWKCWTKRNKKKSIIVVSSQSYELAETQIFKYFVPSMRSKWPRAGVDGVDSVEKK